MSPFLAYICTITIFVSLLAGGVAVANLLHFRKTERKLREDPDGYLRDVQPGEGDLW